MNIYSIAPLVSALFLYSLGIVSLVSGRRETVWRVFSAFCFLLGTTSFFAMVTASSDIAYFQKHHRFLRLAPLFAYLSIVFGIFYSAVLTGMQKCSSIFGKKFSLSINDEGVEVCLFGKNIPPKPYFVAWVLFVAIVLALLLRTDWLISSVQRLPSGRFDIEFGPLIYLVAVLIIMALVKIITLLSAAYRSSDSLPFKKFLKLNIIGFASIYTPAGFMMVILPIFGMQTQIYTFIAFPIAVIIFYIAIVRYQFDRVEELNLNLERKVDERTYELRQAQSRVAQAEKMASMGQLVAGVAHEVNNPIGAVRSMHQTMMLGVNKVRDIVSEAPDEIRNCSELTSAFEAIENADKVIEDGTSRVRNIVKQLKSFARLDEADLQKSDINKGIEDTLSLLEHELKDIKIVKNYGEIEEISCYPGQLNQVWLNLLVNAKQAIENTEGEIRISTKPINGHIEINIRDNGSGISEQDMTRIFDPGFTTKGMGVGTGLGLGICYQIVKDHNGDIEVHSKKGEGASFTVKIPDHLNNQVD